ncbi:MAG: 5-amino-6-(D-ribitylamino)uracil--L-tyrosine 4-hydroxyphenyl transferase CofH [Solirubrobacteraceae bacterium]
MISDLDLLLSLPDDDIIRFAAAVRDERGSLITYSPKAFVPLTNLCRDVCHYCTFARPARRGRRAFMTVEEVLRIAEQAARAGCTELLFTLGDKPELRYSAARDELRALGFTTTIEYLAHVCDVVLDQTGLLPHANPGVMTSGDVALLRAVSASQGLMLESTSTRLCERGGPHYGSPDKLPARRVETIRHAGELSVPFTTGILIGIGETRRERLEALVTIRELHQQYGHIQEVIVQNFRAKPGTLMASATEPTLLELQWTIAAARLVLGADMSIQAPPNLSGDAFGRLLDAGINDWGGVSPVTPDHVNPEAAWPALEALSAVTEAHGHQLAARLPLYPAYIADITRWTEPRVATAVLQLADADGLARGERWSAGDSSITVPDATIPPRPSATPADRARDPRVAEVLDKHAADLELDEDDVEVLLRARGADVRAVCERADALRRRVCGDTVTYIVTRNINYTNVCYFRCGFCAFSKGRLAANLRGAPYIVPRAEIVRRCVEAWERGAVEVCLQGGIHPGFTGEYYLDVCRAIKRELPDIHVHAFSALEVWQGAATLGLELHEYLAELREAGLASLPGTAAEILDDEVRDVLCPDKITTEEWLAVHDAAHSVGLRSTTTIMFGHVESARSWARHLLALRDQQKRSGGFTEFVPLPFVHMEAPIFRRGRARPGPTFREVLLMHAVARLALHPHITNIQVSWVKIGLDGAAQVLGAGGNDLGGTLMNESISRAAGAAHGQEMSPEQMDAAIRAMGRTPRQRTTLYGAASPERVSASYGAPPLAEPRQQKAAEVQLPRRDVLVRSGRR